MSEKKTKEEIESVFGFDPNSIGLRNRGFWIADPPDEEDLANGVEPGDLIVKSRDGGSNPIDPDAFRVPNYRTTYEDIFDCTYRYYVYSPIQPQPNPEE